MLALLIRHAANDSIGAWVAGRSPGLHLNGEGRRQAKALRERLGPLPITAVYSSPLERALETAVEIANGRGLEVRVEDDLVEIDYGEWTGVEARLRGDDPRWVRYNTLRSRTRAPGGESMIEVQARVVGVLERLASAHPRETIAVCSHGDPIRAAVAYYAGIAIDLCLRIEIALASVSAVVLDEHPPRLLALNDTGRILGQG